MENETIGNRIETINPPLRTIAATGLLEITKGEKHSKPTEILAIEAGYRREGFQRTVPTIVTAHTFCASRDARVSYGWCILSQEYFCAV